jgi:L-threonylcarbamoyladenylate synthase
MTSSSQNPIAIATQKLADGFVVGMPTETVYGLAARIDLPAGIEAIFRVKERPFFDPLIVHVHSLDQVGELTTEFSAVARALAAAFWPGPLTLVLPKGANVNDMITSGLESVGIRMPRHPVALELLRAVGMPLAAPSANKFGKTSPTSAEHVRKEFVKEDVFVLEGGESEIGIESTVLSLKDVGGRTEMAILRPGHIVKSEIESVLTAASASSTGKTSLSYVFVEKVDRKASPGQMRHHYMPAVPLILCENATLTEAELRTEIALRMSELPDQIEEVKIVKPRSGIQNLATLVLSADPVLAARNFYSELRRVGESGVDCMVLYRQTSHQGERWQSLYDRIEKAASLVIKERKFPST